MGMSCSYAKCSEFGFGLSAFFPLKFATTVKQRLSVSRITFTDANSL